MIAILKDIVNIIIIIAGILYVCYFFNIIKFDKLIYKLKHLLKKRR